MSAMQEFHESLTKLLDETWYRGRKAGWEDAMARVWELSKSELPEVGPNGDYNPLKEWCLAMAELEVGATPGAGSLAMRPYVDEPMSAKQILARRLQPKLDGEAGKRVNAALLEPARQLSPGLRRTYDYVQAHPGTTAQAMTKNVAINRNALYKLAEMGMIRREQTAIGDRRTSRFYPMEKA